VTPGFLTGLLLVVFAMMFRSWFQVALSTYLPTWIEQTGGDLTTGGRLLALMLFAVSAGSLVGGPAGDRVGHWRVVLVAALVMPVGLWLFLQSTGGAQLLWLAVIGVAIGATYPTSIVLALESWPHQVGFASALVMGVGWWPGGVGASVTGYLADQHSLAVGLQSLLLAPLLTALCILAYAYAVRRHTPPVAQPAEP
jgi:FSR family fosmidomycin resistance protein-like MFS transporter